MIPLLPLYAEKYHPSPVAFGLLMSSYSAMQFLCAPLLGRLSDRFGRRPVLLVSLAGTVVGYLLFAFALPLMPNGVLQFCLHSADRYFVEEPINGDRARLVGSEAHHLSHVMRAKVGTEVVLFDGSGVEWVAEVVRLCVRERVPFVPRGAGTGLSGGALALEGGVVIGLNRMNRVLEVDYANQRAVIEPGLVNIWLTNQVSPDGYYYAPDPASQTACSVGGNVAENSGGPHCLKYGVTTNHVLGLEVVLASGKS